VEYVEQWARVRRHEGGDDMYASSLVTPSEDHRDATFIRYDMLVDIDAKKPRHAPEFMPKSFFGQLQHILVVHLPIIRALGLNEPTTLLLAEIRPCRLEALNALHMPYFSSMAQSSGHELRAMFSRSDDR